jgi:L-lactate utilization protein LutB
MSSDRDAGPARTPTAAAIRQVMDAEGAAVAANTQGFNAGRYDAVAGLEDYEALKAEARAIKADAIERLPELIAELTATVEANGGSVYLADDAADANAHIRELVAAADAQRLVKSKSMTTEEIEVNAALAADGVEVVETDLGEWVLQLAEEAPSHIVAPAIHKSREEIAALFAETFDPTDPPETAAELTRFARERLGALIEGADVGMTGANFITADTGTLALVTSEGNARKTAVVPDTHIAVAGVEKVVPSVEDLAPFIELIGRSGTGQDITSYISLLTPPVRSPVPDFDVPAQPLSTGDPDRTFHLVLIDNGRARDAVLHPLLGLLEHVCELPERGWPRLRRGDLLGGHRDGVGGGDRGAGRRRRLQRPVHGLLALCARLPGGHRHPLDQHGGARPPQPVG